METDEPTSTQIRDGVILRVMGCFFGVFGVLVSIGLFWPQSTEARIVSACAAFLLLLCGGITFWFGRPKRKV